VGEVLEEAAAMHGFESGSTRSNRVEKPAPCGPGFFSGARVIEEAEMVRQKSSAKDAVFELFDDLATGKEAQQTLQTIGMGSAAPSELGDTEGATDQDLADAEPGSNLHGSGEIRSTDEAGQAHDRGRIDCAFAHACLAD
jgi:hypothetical protein